MNNKVPQIHLIYNRYKKADAKIKAVVEIRVTHNRKQKYLSTGIWLYPNQWKDGKITNCDNILQISQVLDKLVSNVRQVIIDMIQEGNIDIFTIQDRLNKKEFEKIGFIDFCNQRAAVREYGKEKDTQERYERFLKKFISWGKIKSFSDINDKNIIAYDKYLIQQGMKNYSKWQNYHRFLNSFILDAIDEGLLQRNPYKWINIEKGKDNSSLDKCLTLKEFSQLRMAKMPTESLERVKDLFVFQTYTCLRYSDLARFNPNNIVIIDGTEVYKFNQKKTKKETTIPLLQPALDILTNYRGVLPIISNVKYNLYLKSVAQAAGLDVGLTTHWARHTGATLLLNEGIDMKIVTKICGHSSMKITEQIYAKLLDETIIDAIKKKEDNLK